MRILVINQHTSNYGDDAAGVALLLQLRTWFPEAELGISYNWKKPLPDLIPFEETGVSHYPEIVLNESDLGNAVRYVILKTLGITTQSSNNLGKYLELIRSADIVVVSPCGANMGIYRNWLFLFRVLVAVLEEKPVYFQLNTLGKSGNFIFDQISKYVLKRSHVFVREYKSFNELKAWGINSAQGVDSAFSLPATSKQEEDPFIAFIPTQLSGWHPKFQNSRAEDAIFRLIIPTLAQFAKKHGLKIKVIPHLHGDLSEKGFLDKIVTGFSQKSLNSPEVCLASINDFWAYERAIANSALTVSMRYHGIVFAAKNAVPFVSLSYENKMAEVCTYTNMSELNIDMQSLESQALLACLENAHSNRMSIIKTLEAQLPKLKKLSELPVPEMYLQHLYNK